MTAWFSSAAQHSAITLRAALAQACHEPAAIGSLGVTVGIKRQDPVNDKPLDRPKGAAGRNVVGVDERLRAERSRDFSIAANKIVRQAGKSILGFQSPPELLQKSGRPGVMRFPVAHATFALSITGAGYPNSRIDSEPFFGIIAHYSII